MTEPVCYADIIIDLSASSLDRPFGYRIPPHLNGRVSVGSVVIIPFGQGNTHRRGYVLALTEKPSYEPDKMKDIIRIDETATEVENRSLELALFLKKTYGGTLAQALKTVLPAKTKVKALEKKTVLRRADAENLTFYLGEAIRKKQHAKRRLIEALLEQEEIPYGWLREKLGVTGNTIHSLEEAGLLKVETQQYYRNPVLVSESSCDRPVLNEEQQAICSAFREDLAAGRIPKYLIHGVTGSGKTEVYLDLIEQTVRGGGQVIFLIPEIALTYQTLIRFYRRFGDRVSVINSSLSAGERYDQCLRAAAGEIDIIIGPRSALFIPFPNLKLIVIDEEHESSYKSENVPRYHAREVAEEIARRAGAGLVLGSATPSLEAYYGAGEGRFRLFRMVTRATGASLPHVDIVDLRTELREGNRSIFSRKLQGLLRDRIEKGEQSILFLNRRGVSGFISCRSCGEVMKCPHCEVSLTEHYGGKLLCHYCGYEQNKPPVCPSCGSKYLMGFKAGTEQVQEKIQEMFPGVKCLRMDADTTRTKDSYEKILSAFANEEAQILIGTQMIVKGHDFPHVTLACVLAADLSLGTNDYRAGERTFQLLTQAVGRAGRGQTPGEAIIQTYQPEHYAITMAASQNYEAFYEEEIGYRKMAGYPPAAHLLAIAIIGTYQDRAEALALKIARTLKSLPMSDMTRRDENGNRLLPDIRVLGPSPAKIAKLQDKFRFVIYVKADSYDMLIKAKDEIENELYEIPGRREQVLFDFDPVYMV